MIEKGVMHLVLQAYAPAPPIQLLVNAMARYAGERRPARAIVFAQRPAGRARRTGQAGAHSNGGSALRCRQLSRPLKYQSTPPLASSSMAALIDER